ncbi:MAG TPA: hypothetical protein DDY77_07140 [Clostridiales bacterium]|nr:hypothetical protein [Clostridiales bacterium]
MANKKTKKQAAYENAAKKKGKTPVGLAALTDLTGQDGYTRKKVEVGRWSYGASLLTGSFNKTIVLNLLMVLFLAPLIFMLARKNMSLLSASASAPFGANMILGMTPAGNMAGLKESLSFMVNREFYLFLPLCAFVLGIGLSGGMYVMRNMAWGNDVSVASAFFKGIKRNFLNVVILTLCFSLFAAAAGIGISYINYEEAIAGGKWYYLAIKICVLVVLAFLAVWYLTCVTFTETFGSSFGTMLKNSLKISFYMFPLNIFFAAFALLPVGLFFLGTSFLFIGAMLYVLFGASFTLVVWTVYSQWLYDKFIDGRLTKVYEPTEKEVAEKKRKETLAKEKEVAGGFISAGEGAARIVREEEAVERIIAEPVTDGGETLTIHDKFTRKDIEKLTEKKLALKEQAEKFVAENKPTEIVTDKKKK